MTTEPKMPRPQDFDDHESYEAAMNAFLGCFAPKADKPADQAVMDVLREWRQDPPQDGWE